ncbi:MAG: peptide-methionine (R)-S-oxide reductase [Nitrososphaeraceae archaeon]|nr:peptide-methionine (R)-S-oxide reductase [Nitrososphaeraceae archaeon]
MSKEEIINKSENEWRNELTPEQYQICRMKGTEPAFTGKYWNSKDNGIYNVFVVVIIYFHRRLNLILVQVGQVFLLQSTKKM